MYKSPNPLMALIAACIVLVASLMTPAEAAVTVTSTNFYYSGNVGDGLASVPATPPDIALPTAGGVPFAGSYMTSPALRPPANLNNGSYAGPQAWIGETHRSIDLGGEYGSVDMCYAGIMWTNSSGVAPHSITGFSFGRDNSHTWTDRCAGNQYIQYTTSTSLDGTTNDTAAADANWTTLGYVDCTGDPYAHVYVISNTISPLIMTGIRIVTKGNDGTAANSIDELAVYGNPTEPPVVDNDGGAIDVSAGVSQLRGTLSDEKADVYIYWGTEDGDTNKTDWAHTNLLEDTAVGSFTNTVSNLLYGVTYHYRCYASNIVDDAWASSTADFTTLAPYPYYDTLKISFTNLYDRVEALPNFPALVVFTNDMGGSGFSYSNFLSSSGHDLRFWDEAQTTTLKYEIENWNTNGNSHVWVRIPNFTSNSYVWATWGDPNDADQPAYTTNGATWDSSFAGVWHKLQYDSTSNRNDGTLSGTMPTDGVVDGARYLDGAGDTMFTPTNTSLAFGESGTLSFWVGMDDWTPSANQNFINNNIAYNDPGNVWISQHNVVGLHFRYGQGAAPAYASSADSQGWVNGSYHHIAGTWTNTGPNSATIRLYADGQLLDTSSPEEAITIPVNSWLWGSQAGGVGYLPGGLDEGRIQNVERSINWFWAEFMNQGSNSMFVTPATVMSVAAEPLPPIQNGSATSLEDTTADLVATLDATTAVYHVWAYWGTVDGTNNAEGLWQHTNSLGWYTNETIVLTNHVTDLQASTPYYYTFRATNSLTNVWASPSTEFETLSPPAAPAVNNDSGALNVSPGVAELRGTLTDGVFADVYVYWGPTDGEDSKTAWAHTNLLEAAEEGSFTNTVSNLLYGVTYHYRCYASNSVDSAWALSTASFTSMALPSYSDSLISASGAITNYMLNGINYIAHIFTNSGAFEVTESASVEVLVVGGGGGGGSRWGGGGGAGGYLHTNGFLVVAGSNYTVTVGDGGMGGPATGGTGTSGASLGTNGEDSVFGSLTAYGGGGGGPGNGLGGLDGGSGGGASGRVEASGGFALYSGAQGHDGGDGTVNSFPDAQGAGGGGAGGDGGDGGHDAMSDPDWSAGGPGVTNWIAGPDRNAVYAGGGGGGGGGDAYGGPGGVGGGGHGGDNVGGSLLPAVAGTPNTGGGGGGGARTADPNGPGAAGGSGIVVVRYPVILVNDAATNVTRTTADLVATLSATQAVYHVRAYWGTVDGTNNAAGLWQNSSPVGWYTNETVALTNHVTGLSSGAEYYYTFSATNDATDVWASPSVSFTTIPPGAVFMLR